TRSSSSATSPSPPSAPPASRSEAAAAAPAPAPAASLAPGDLQGTAVEGPFDLGEVYVVAGELDQREVEHVGGLVDLLGARRRFGQLVRLLAQLGAEPRRVGEQPRGVGAFGCCDLALRQAAGERPEAGLRAPAGARGPMAEARRLPA